MESAKKIVIIGAGPSGLAVALDLVGNSDFNITILESEKNVGGLCRTLEHKGIRFDIGPHRLSPQLPEIVKIVQDLLGDDLLAKENLHGLYFDEILYNYPPKFSDFLNLNSVKNAFIFGKSFILRQFLNIICLSFSSKKEKSFEDILTGRFGKCFYNRLILPMALKVWGTSDLDKDFVDTRITIPTFSKLLKKIFIKNAAINDKIFYYPVKGFSQIWDKIAEKLSRNGHLIELNVEIERIEADTLDKGPYKIYYLKDGEKKVAEADILVSTISNKVLLNYFSETSLTKPIMHLSNQFSSRTVRIGVFLVKAFDLPVRVTIFPEQKHIFNRISVMNHFADLDYPEGQTVLMIDVIYHTDSKYADMSKEEFNEYLIKYVLELGWFKQEDITDVFSVIVPYAYPVMSKSRYQAQDELENYFASTDIILCGREASSDYNNAHNAMAKGLLTAKYISGKIKYDEYIKLSREMGRLPVRE
ncbi:MAG: FAD-dependent oxidoreductase [Candidatus Gastranaerophilales bacterium]|nr:FAD-dependent oxidoreductase [Candidatus Gastranaerophilales bacterium]